MGRNSPIADVTPVITPTDSLLAPPPGAAKSKHYRDREVQRHERRLKARRKAAEMLEAAMGGCGDPKLAAIAEFVVHKLRIEYCDILQFASDRWVVVVRAKATDRDGAPARARRSETSGFSADATHSSIELVRLADHMASLDVLRTEGTIDRIHVFISSRQQLTPLGILTVQSRTSLRLTSDERSFLDALGDLIGAAIDSHALPTGDELSRTKPLRTEPGSRPGARNGSGSVDRV